MSREIKFRAWDKESKEMCYDCSSLGWNEDGKLTDWEGQRPSGGAAVLWEDEFEIMQYTGLSDKNGKDIYEGDILQNTNPIWKKEITPFVVVWDNAVSFSDYSPREDFEVIGNIYENPELIK